MKQIDRKRVKTWLLESQRYMMDVEVIKSVLRNRIGELELEASQAGVPLERNVLEIEQFVVEIALIRMEHGIELGDYRSIVDSVVARGCIRVGGVKSPA